MSVFFIGQSLQHNEYIHQTKDQILPKNKHEIVIKISLKNDQT